METVKKEFIPLHVKNFILTKIAKKGFVSNFIMKTALYILLIDLAFVFAYPFIFLLVTSVKSPTDLMDITVVWVPKEIFWKNFASAAIALKYATGFRNSAIVTTLAVIGHLLSCSFVAYGFARYKFPFRDALFSIVILSMIVPVQTLIFPLYIMYSKVKLINTYIPLILPTFMGFGLRGALFIFIFRQFFLGLPWELEDAAKVDGCSAIRTFWSIVRPVCSSAILVTTVLGIVWHWNDYFEPNIYITNARYWLLPANLPTMYSQLSGDVDESAMVEGEVLFNNAVVMAGTFLVILPILTVFLILQRKFMRGVERTGLVG